MSDVPGVNAAYWWVGQVVDESNWQKEQTGIIHNPNQTKGETFSYKVRIVGRHTSTTPGIDLPTASVALPVTAGGGLAGSVQTPNIRQGSYVVGFYRDGKDGNEPFIAFVLPVNPKTSLFPEDPPNGFIPRSGFTGKPISTTNISVETKIPTESVDPNIFTTSDKDKFIDGQRYFYIPKTKACEGPSGPLKGIQKSISEALSVVNLIKSGIAGTSSDLQGLLSGLINSIEKKISGLVKTLIESMRTFVMNKINKEFSEKLDKFNPQERIKYSKEFESLNDIIFCIFQKSLRKITSLVKSLLESIIDKFVNAPLCAAENFLASVMSNIFSDLTGGIGGILESTGISNITSQLFSGLNVIIGALEFLTCEDELNCEMPEQWSIFSGPKTFIENISSQIDNKLTGITSSIISGSNTSPVCSVSQLPCGPPSVNFISSSGSGASANPIVSFSGSIIGFDVISGGNGYSTPPNVEITDGCGNGSGAYGVAITKDGSVDKIVVVDGGSGYLQYPDGSTGGNGYKFSDATDIIIFNQNTGYSVYKEDVTVNVISGDLLYAPPFTNITVYSPQGDILQEIVGEGLTVPITIEYNGTITTSNIEQNFPNVGPFPSSNNSYPAVTTIEDIAIVNPGSNYQPEDNVSITPSNGAEISVTFDDNGSLKDAVVISGGLGFTEFPEIRINSKTGFNAKIIPVFKVIRIGDLKEEQDVIPDNTPIIKIIDCVGVVEK